MQAREEEGWFVTRGGVPWKGDRVSRRLGSPLSPTAEGGHRETPWRPEAGLPVMVPEHCWQLGSAQCQAGNPPLPGESLLGHFIVFLRTARSFITSPHLPQMLHIPAILCKCAEPYSISPKRALCSTLQWLGAVCPGWPAGLHLGRRPSQREGNCPAPKDVPTEATAGDTALPLTRVSGTAHGSECRACKEAGPRAAKVQANRGERRNGFQPWWHHGRLGHLWASP